MQYNILGINSFNLVLNCILFSLFSYLNYTSKINQCWDSMNNTCKIWDYDHSQYSSTIVTEVMLNFQLIMFN